MKGKRMLKLFYGGYLVIAIGKLLRACTAVWVRVAPDTRFQAQDAMIHWSSSHGSWNNAKQKSYRYRCKSLLLVI